MMQLYCLMGGGGPARHTRAGTNVCPCPQMQQGEIVFAVLSYNLRSPGRPLLVAHFIYFQSNPLLVAHFIYFRSLTTLMFHIFVISFKWPFHEFRL